MRERFLQFVALVIGALGAVLLASGVVASAGEEAGAGPLADLSTFPVPLPSGCPEGSGALQGVRFSTADSGADTTADLSQLALEAGDGVIMRWDGFAANCLDGSGRPVMRVTLAAYLTPTATFDSNVDQRLVDWTSCGPGAAECAGDGSGYRLQLAIPAEAVGCQFQIDAILGAPLAAVGPSGSFYSAELRGGHGPNLLIGATNFAVAGCNDAAGGTTPATVMAEATTTTTTTTTPSTASTAVEVASTTAPIVLAAQPAQAALAAQVVLPATGVHSSRTLGAGGLLLVMGLALMVLSMLLGMGPRHSVEPVPVPGRTRS